VIPYKLLNIKLSSLNQKIKLKKKGKKKEKKMEGPSLFILDLAYNLSISLHCSFYYKT
jgi:hypothetical protein